MFPDGEAKALAAASVVSPTAKKTTAPTTATIWAMFHSTGAT